MRKIWLSSNVACSASLSSIALARSVPNGFSMMMRAPLGQPGLAEPLHDLGRGRGRDAEVVQPRDVAAELVLELADGLGQRFGAGRLADVGEPRRERRPSRRRGHRGARTRRARRARRQRKPSSSRSSSDVPTIRHSGNSPACARWNRPGSSLRRARSPVAPNSTMTCGRSGEIRLELMSVGSERMGGPPSDRTSGPVRPGFARTAIRLRRAENDTPNLPSLSAGGRERKNRRRARRASAQLRTGATGDVDHGPTRGLPGTACGKRF